MNQGGTDLGHYKTRGGICDTGWMTTCHKWPSSGYQSTCQLNITTEKYKNSNVHFNYIVNWESHNYISMFIKIIYLLKHLYMEMVFRFHCTCQPNTTAEKYEDMWYSRQFYSSPLLTMLLFILMLRMLVLLYNYVVYVCD